jgi:hypothetical protein
VADSTNGPIAGEPLLAPFDLAFVRGPKRLEEDFEAYKRKWAGKLRGRIILFTPAQQMPPRDAPLFKRESDTDLAATSIAPDPAAELRAVRLDDVPWPEHQRPYSSCS